MSSQKSDSYWPCFVPYEKKILVIHTSRLVPCLQNRFCFTHNCIHHPLYPCTSPCGSLFFAATLVCSSKLWEGATPSCGFGRSLLKKTLLGDFCLHQGSNFSKRTHRFVFDWNNFYSSALLFAPLLPQSKLGWLIDHYQNGFFDFTSPLKAPPVFFAPKVCLHTAQFGNVRILLATPEPFLCFEC